MLKDLYECQSIICALSQKWQKNQIKDVFIEVKETKNELVVTPLPSLNGP